MAKRVFKVNEKELAIVQPSVEQKRRADIYRSATFAKLAKAGVIFRDSLFKILREQGVWSDEKEQEHDKLRKDLRDALAKLDEGKLDKEEAKKVATEARTTRLTLLVLLSDYHKLDEYTIEGQCDQSKFEFLVSECTVWNDSGRRYFSSLDDYVDKEDMEEAEYAASEFAKLYHNYSEENPEDKFLKQDEPEINVGA